MQVFVAMIEAEFTSFQMQQKRTFGHARELVQPALSETPEQLDAVNVGHALHVLVPAAEHAVVAVVAHVDQAVVAALAVGFDYGSGVDFAPDDALQRRFRAIEHDFRVHPPRPLEQAEDNGFAARPPAPLAAHAARAK